MAAVVPLIPPFADLPEAVQALRTERERVFVWTYMFNGANGSRAAKAAGYSDVKGGARVRAHELLQRDDVGRALQALCTKYLFSLAPLALAKHRDHLMSKNEKISQKAVEMTFNRTGMSERTALDVNVSGRVEHVDHTKAAIDDLRKLKTLGVPHAALVETFGFSGLSRLEKLLAEQDAKALPPPVDAEFTEITQGAGK